MSEKHRDDITERDSALYDSARGGAAAPASGYAVTTTATPKIPLARRYDGPRHTADQKCEICGSWGAEDWLDVGGAGICRMTWLCRSCIEEAPRHSNQTLRTAPTEDIA